MLTMQSFKNSLIVEQFQGNYRKLDLATVGKFCFNFSRVLDGVLIASVSNPARARALKLMLACCAERVRINKSRHRP